MVFGFSFAIVLVGFFLIFVFHSNIPYANASRLD